MAERVGSTVYLGLTEPQLAKKLGFPSRVFMPTSKGEGGPGLLYWSYYERSTPTIEEKVFAFTGSPLKVSSAPAELTPARFLSLDRTADVQEILLYEAHRER